MRNEYFAHTSDSHDNEKLIDHLRLTADLAEANGLAFHNEKVCRQLGLLHDVGKRTESFQQVLEKKKTKQDHAIVAAIYYFNHGLIDNVWLKKRLALIMAAHHSNLYTMEPLGDGNTQHKSGSSSHNINFAFKEENINCEWFTTLDRMKEIAVSDNEEYNDIQKYIDEHQLLMELEESDYFPIKDMTMNERMFYVRMLYSCLVDADYSATAEYSNSGWLEKHFYMNRFDVDTFTKKFDTYHDDLIKNATDSDMNRLRNQVYDSCAENGSKKTGFLTLTAPTGTGKTLALMKFALQQAKAFHKNRIIVILPFLSIIDQNANIYQEIFGRDAVLVDDSQTEYTDETRIQSERWSSPIIVTTSVKFFSTLFTSKATDVRRLHNIANSVVVFDECQTLPSYVLNSSIEVLNSLVKYYNTTVLFSTATKPSYKYREKGGEDIRPRSILLKDSIAVSLMRWQADEIMNNVESAFAIYNKIKNTSVTFTKNKDTMDCESLIDYYADEQAALYIFNTTSHASEMYDAVVNRYGSDGCYIITSKFCAVDKLYIIDKVNRRLKNGEFVRLIATQCIEAGVDFDFPVGAREFAPLDSVIQSSGRVNRNGLQDGRFLVFKYIKSSRYDYPTTDYRNASCITIDLSDKNNGIDFYNLQMMDKYFNKLYHTKGYDKDDKFLRDGIYFDCYQNVTSNYKIIDSNRQATMLVRPVFADTVEFDRLIDKIKKNNFIITKGDLKRLSKYTLAVYYNKTICPSSFSEPLHFRYDDDGMGWFYVDDDSFYTDRGFDAKARVGSVF